MAIWKQALGVLAVAVAAVLLWAALVPASRPVLDRIGLLGPLERIGVVSDPGEPGSGGAGAGQGGGRGPARVVAEPVVLGQLNNRITAIGTARSVRSVTLAAEISGKLARVAVASGDYVEAGAVVAELDSEAARIKSDRATLRHANELRNLERLTRLRESGSVTDLQLQEAELAERSAELDMREAEFELTRHRIVAPVAGWVGIIEVEPGDLVSPGAQITVVEDRSALLVDFRVPERVAAAVDRGTEVTARSLADPGSEVQGAVSALDNRVDEQSRTLRLQATIPNEGDRLRPGMAIALSVVLQGEPTPSVDPLAIQWGTDGPYVWLLRDGRAQTLGVRILERTSDAVLVEADFEEGDLVVTEGMTALRPGAEALAVEARSGGEVLPVSSKG